MQPATSSELRIAPVTTDCDYELFLSLPGQVYRGDPNWIAPNHDFEAAEVRGKTPFAAHTRLQPFVAERGGKPVARAIALHDPVFDAHWGEKAGHMAMFEAMPGEEAAAIATLDAACDWLRQHGCEYVRSGFLMGWSMPYVIDAYDRAATFLHTYNPPYYHSFLKNAGFITERGVVEYQVQFTPESADRYRSLIAAAESRAASVKPWDFARIEQENSRFTAVFNDTFAQHWGASQMTEREMGGLTVGMRDLLVPESCAFAEVDGETAGGVYALPDMNCVANGRPLDHGILLIIGVREPFRKRGINLALGARCFLGFLERGYKSASYTVVLDDNWRSRKTAEKLGCRVEKNFVIYRRDLRSSSGG